VLKRVLKPGPIQVWAALRQHSKGFAKAFPPAMEAPLDILI
jgi:hypothetical protein